MHYSFACVLEQASESGGWQILDAIPQDSVVGMVTGVCFLAGQSVLSSPRCSEPGSRSPKTKVQLAQENVHVVAG